MCFETSNPQASQCVKIRDVLQQGQVMVELFFGILYVVGMTIVQQRLPSGYVVLGGACSPKQVYAVERL